MSEEDDLTGKEKMNLVIEAGISSIPYVGGSLQTLYYGAKNEKRFKRIERFYSELQQEIECVKNLLPDLHQSEYSNEAIGILESINDEIEKASSQSKIRNYTKAYKNTLLNFNKSSFDKEKHFVRLLPDLTDLEISILFQSTHNEYKKVNKGYFYNHAKSNINLVSGSINRLLNFGLLKVVYGRLLQGRNGSYIEQDFSVSDLGSEFVSFIFE